jgi:hypothetical protein
MIPTRTVNRIKQSAPTHNYGVRIFLASLVLGAAGIAPLLFYILLGPADGNPIGLGLLAVVAALASIAGMAIGSIAIVVDFFARPKA